MASKPEPNYDTDLDETAGEEAPERKRRKKSAQEPERKDAAARGDSRPRKKKRKTKEKRKGRWLIGLIPLVLLLAVGAFYFHQNYLFIGGHVYSRDLAEMDLRGTKVSVDTYEEVKAALPNTTVYWDVPLSGGAADAQSRSITINALSEDDLALLDYFTGLESVDATAAELTTEQFEQLSAKLPGADIRWSVPVGGGRFASDAESVKLESLSDADMDMFDYFTALRSVDARACSNYDTIMALRDRLAGVEVSWQVPLSGREYLDDAEEVRIDDPSLTVAALEEALRYLPKVKSVDAPQNNWTPEEKTALLAAWPEISFRWPVTIFGKQYMGDDTQIDLSGRKLSDADLEELTTWGVFLPGVEQIDLSGCGLNAQQLTKVHETFPNAELVWQTELYGVPIDSKDTLLNFKNVEGIKSTDEIEALIPLMPNLEKIDMCETGLDNETLDAMNKRYDNVRVIWTIHISYYTIRTDDKGFRASSRYYGYLTNENLHLFKYCPDMVSMDLGHRNLTDLSFCYEMPQLKHLILLHWRVTDLTPLGSLKNLVWLELNKLDNTSMAPLEGCTGLKDLNIAFTGFLDRNVTFETLMKMDGLERLWYSVAQLSNDQVAKIQAAHPDLVMHPIWDPDLDKDDPWRYDADYYEMRDNMNIFYMNCGGRINFKIIDGVRYDLDPEFLASQGDNSEDRLRMNQVR